MRGRIPMISTLALGFALGACQTVPSVPPSAADVPPDRRYGVGQREPKK